MAKQNINIGTAANSGNGDPLRTAFTKVNENFTELYARAVFSGSYADLTNKPTIFSGSYADLTNKPTIFSGSYSDLTNKPTLFSGSYNDLTNKPTIRTDTSQSTNIEVTNAQTLYNNAISGWEYARTIGEYSTQPGWTFNTWVVDGTNASSYVQQLSDAWQIQANPSSPPTPLVFTPPISAALYNQIRAQLQQIAGSYDLLQTLLTSVDVNAGNTKLSILANDKLVVPEIIQTTPDEDLIIRTRYTTLTSPPGDIAYYQNRNFRFGTNGGLTFPNGTTQYGAAIDLAYLKSIVANCNSFDDFKNTIASL